MTSWNDVIRQNEEMHSSLETENFERKSAHSFVLDSHTNISIEKICLQEVLKILEEMFLH